MKDKVILSNAYTDTLLSLAFQEGLLTADPDKNDHVYEKYKKKPIDYHLAKSLLEQLLLSPYPIIRQKLHSSVEGKLLEDNNIFFDAREINTVVPMNNYPTEMFLGILKGRGIEMSKQQFIETIDEIIKINEEYNKLEIEFGGELPSLAFKKLAQEISNDPTFMEDEKHKKLENVNVQANRVSNKLMAILEFLELQTIAEEQDAVIKIQAQFDNINQDIEKYDNIGDAQTLILRLVEKEFGYISLRTSSLRETLILAQTPEFIAYRTKLDEWINKLISGEYNDLENIRKEIRRARKYIDMKPVIDTGGNFLAFLGVPLALFTLATPIGLGLAVAGVVPCLANIGLEKKYKWAMINQVNP
ncbi:MAG: hypothetical protein ACKV1O_30005 [Saprospiraceae bacterium]